MVRHHLMVHPLTIWAPSQKPMNAQEGHPYHSFNLSPLPSLSKLPVNRDELQSTMNATIATICNLLQTLLPQSKVIATIEYCKCKPYIAIKCCSYNNMTTQLCTIARLHCYNRMSRQCIATKLWHVPSQSRYVHWSKNKLEKRKWERTCLPRNSLGDDKPILGC